jgi:hypothetical protein
MQVCSQKVKKEGLRIIWSRPKIKGGILIDREQKKYISGFAFFLYHYSLSRLP